MLFRSDADEWAALPGTAFPNSSIERVSITHDNGILKNAVSVDLKNVNFESSVQVQLYSGETLLTIATLKTGFLTVGKYYPFVTCCIPTEGEDAAWSLTSWTPKDDVVPTKAVLVVDGRELAEKAFTLNADEWVNLPGTASPDSGSIERVGITHAGGVLKNAVSVDLKNVTFKTSVEVQLYSGETLLTTATLKTGVLTVGQNHPFVTCCIPTEGEDEAWSLTPWTPKDNVVPDTAVLFVDGNEQDTKIFTLDADEWANLPGTYGGSIERVGITHAVGNLKDAVSVDLKNVNFKSSVKVQLYSGGTLLTTATLNTDKLGAGSYPYLTCCIATETADEYWSLTSWTPKDDVVPNKVVLFVDDNEMDTMEFTLDAAEWAALPGTVLPSSNVTNGTTSNNDKLDNVPQTGDTSNFALWIALLFVSGGAAIGTTVVSRKKKCNR